MVYLFKSLYARASMPEREKQRKRERESESESESERERERERESVNEMDFHVTSISTLLGSSFSLSVELPAPMGLVSIIGLLKGRPQGFSLNPVA